MNVSAFIEKCVEIGISISHALEAGKVYETAVSQAVDEALEARRANDRARQERHRAKTCHVMSRDKAENNVTKRESRDTSRVVYTSLPSEEVITSEPKGSSVVVLARDPETKSPKSRGTRLPDDWEPSGADIEVARSEGLTDEEIARAVREFRNYWCARSGRDATKVSWSRTWENRCIELSRRFRGDREKLASRPAQTGGGGRGAVSFADIYARRHGYAQD